VIVIDETRERGRLGDVWSKGWCRTRDPKKVTHRKNSSRLVGWTESPARAERPQEEKGKLDERVKKEKGAKASLITPMKKLRHK